MDDKKLKRYLEYIQFEGEIHPDLETLSQIQQKHIARIAFENLNPLLGLPVLIDESSIYKKIIEDERGGYCFEQNLLLKAVLKHIGFEVRGLMGRAGVSEETAGRTHLVLLVTLDGKQYLVDVGYGGLVPTGPLLMELDITQQTPNQEYRIVKHNDEFRLEIFLFEKWKRLYEFSLLSQRFPDFEIGNWYASASPDSRFTKQFILARTDIDNRYTLDSFTFSAYPTNGHPTKQTIQTLEELKDILTNVFKINISQLKDLDKIVMPKQS